MRAFNRARSRGFTLIELIIVVAVVGMLAVIAIYGVRHYVTTAKTAEAKTNVGAIARGAVAAFEREAGLTSTLLTDGDSSAVVHQLCAATLNPPTPPLAMVKGLKYQPVIADGADFNTGDPYTGWKCLRFALDHPIYYAYTYTVAGSGSSAGDTFAVIANGDLNGDGVTSSFMRNGAITQGLEVTLSTQLTITNETE